MIPTLGHTLFPAWADTRTASVRAFDYIGVIANAPTPIHTLRAFKNIWKLRCDGAYPRPERRGIAPAQPITEQATSIVESVAGRAPDDLVVTTATPTGSAKAGIVDYAESVGADLIVMGSRGRGGIERLMLGSVAEHVVRVSDIDVLIHGGA